jgi:signal transduction histidine kinase
MNMERVRRQALLSWVSVGLVAVLCAILAVLQYLWIGEVSRAERERLQQALQTALFRLSEDFNSEINAACSALAPDPAQMDQAGVEAAYAARYIQWRDSSGHERLFRRVALVAPQNDALVLHDLDLRRGVFAPADWPPAWAPLRERLSAWVFDGQRPRGPGGGFTADTANLIELPRFGPPGPSASPPALGVREQGWLVLELDLDYMGAAVFPELLQRHLGAGGRLDYQAEVVTRTNPPLVIYQSDSGPGPRVTGEADASVGVLEVFLRPPRARGREQPKSPPPSFADPGRGRWQLAVRHRAGSLEAVVARARRRNLAVSAGILLLVLATVASLIRFTRQAHRLAGLQMDFVAGVSHELRTPLTVIGTAAYNLQGRMAKNPSQVERYGALIQQECEKLTAIVEQVLQFAGAKAGRVIRERELVSVEALIEEGVQSSQGVLEEAHCLIEKRVEQGLPMIRGDAVALKHALQNLLNNAVKYGSEGSNWIGLFASTANDGNGRVVEIRVVDRGPGIPVAEQEHIFDPFFRGKQAVEDQVRGTGLGLNLVKQIVEAHGGTVRVESAPMKGSAFVVRIPAAPEEQWDEPAHSSRRG